VRAQAQLSSPPIQATPARLSEPGRDMTTDRDHQLWRPDITYIRCARVRVSAVILDAYSAPCDRFASGAASVNAATKSGTNALHGDAFDSSAMPI